MIFNEGNYNKHWDIKTLNELGTFSRGISKHRPRNDTKLFEDGRYPFIQTGDIKSANLYLSHHNSEYGEFGLKQSKLWKTGTLCITIAANIAETAILSYPMCFPDSIVGFNAYKNKSSELFMYYVFEYIKNAIQSSASGSIQDNINIEYLTSLKFRIPNKKLQDKIARLLSSLDKKIENNNKVSEILEKQIHSVYMHYFVRKKSNGRLSDILIENQKSKIYVNEVEGLSGDYPFFTSGSSILEYNDYLVDNRNIYLNTGGNADIKFYVGKTAYSTDTWCISAKNDLEDYLFLLLKTIKNELNIKYFQGTGLKHLQKDLLKNRKIYIPNESEAKLFNQQAKPIMENISMNTQENKKLAKLREWLLPLLMNGQATVSE